MFLKCIFPYKQIFNLSINLYIYSLWAQYVVIAY